MCVCSLLFSTFRYIAYMLYIHSFFVLYSIVYNIHGYHSFYPVSVTQRKCDHKRSTELFINSVKYNFGCVTDVKCRVIHGRLVCFRTRVCLGYSRVIYAERTKKCALNVFCIDSSISRSQTLFMEQSAIEPNVVYMFAFL